MEQTWSLHVFQNLQTRKPTDSPRPAPLHLDFTGLAPAQPHHRETLSIVVADVVGF